MAMHGRLEPYATPVKVRPVSWPDRRDEDLSSQGVFSPQGYTRVMTLRHRAPFRQTPLKVDPPRRADKHP